MALTKRERLEKRRKALKDERTEWETSWKAIAEQLLPYGEVIHNVRDRRNRGDRRDNKILNSRPVLALRILVAGLMAGITSPARKWFKLGLKNEELAENSKDVRVYLETVEREIEAALARSNFYKVLSSHVYASLASICTAVMFEEESTEEAGSVWFTPMPVGQYYLDVNRDGRVDTVFREIPMTVRQVTQKFGVENPKLSMRTQTAYNAGRLEEEVTLIHAVLPNEDYTPGLLGALGKKFMSVWYEDVHERKDVILHESGYHEFPVMAPRWQALPTEAYGHGPGFDVLGDCKMLQHHEKRRLQILDKIVNPPLEVADNVRRASLLPGDITYTPAGQTSTVKPIYTVEPGAFDVIKGAVMELESRISEGLFAHLWSLVMNDNRNQRATATEIEAQRQEVMLQLGPLLENLNDELLEPVIERTYSILERNDFLPLPPEELAGQEIKIEFISIMHQMQKSTGLASMRTLVMELQAIAQLRPDILDKLAVDEIADELRRITGVSSELILSNEEVDEIRAERKQQAQAQQEGEAMVKMTEGIKNLGSTDPNNLQEVAQAVSPVAAAQGGALQTLPQ
jgi:hypothetical protein